MTDLNISPRQPACFPQTRWSVVLAACNEPSGRSTAALDTICRAYWYPLYAHVRRCGYSPHDAQDLTQEFFHRLLEKRWLDSANPNRGRLRTFLIVALKKFLSNEWRRASAQKRGGGETHLPIDTRVAESRYAIDSSGSVQPDELFDRQWALTLIDLTLSRLGREFESSGKLPAFEALKNCLVAERGGIDYASIAIRLGCNEAAARVAVHRLRKRFRELYREEISHTLSASDDVDAELRQLAGVLART